MTLLEQAELLVEGWDEGYSFWDLVWKAAESPGGHIVIRPDFIGIAEEEGDTINVWLAIGEDGVRKALELAPPTVTKAAWVRMGKGRIQSVTFSIEALRNKTMGGFFNGGGAGKTQTAAQRNAMMQTAQPAAKKKGLPVVGGTAAAASPNISMGQRGVM